MKLDETLTISNPTQYDKLGKWEEGKEEGSVKVPLKKFLSNFGAFPLEWLDEAVPLESGSPRKEREDGRDGRLFKV